MVVAHLRRQFEIGAQEGRAKLRDQFLHGIAFIAEALPVELAVKAGLGPVQCVASCASVA